MESKLSEVINEFRQVVLARSGVIDTIAPPLFFVVANALLGFEYAMWSAVALAIVIMFIRLRRRESLLYALGGVGGVLLAFVLVRVLDREEGFFLPGIAIGGITMIVAVISNLVGRPMVAWTSYAARRWPLDWYWHPRVRPAYAEVTWVWAIYFGLKLALQLSFFQNAAADQLAWLNLILGWPATLLLLAFSYLYGAWRLKNLRGPSVEEFKAEAEAPWEGQRQGF